MGGGNSFYKTDVFIPMMLKEATKEELASLNAHRPDVNKDQSVSWSFNHENTAKEIQNRIESVSGKQEDI